MLNEISYTPHVRMITLQVGFRKPFYLGTYLSLNFLHQRLLYHKLILTTIWHYFKIIYIRRSTIGNVNRKIIIIYGCIIIYILILWLIIFYFLFFSYRFLSYIRICHCRLFSYWVLLYRFLLLFHDLFRGCRFRFRNRLLIFQILLGCFYFKTLFIRPFFSLS